MDSAMPERRQVKCTGQGIYCPLGLDRTTPRRRKPAEEERDAMEGDFGDDESDHIISTQTDQATKRRAQYSWFWMLHMMCLDCQPHF